MSSTRASIRAVLLEARLDTSGLVPEHYVLQVSSPGDRPLRSPVEWRRFVGRWVSVLAPEHGGRFEGKLLDVGGEEGQEEAVMEVQGKRTNVPLAGVKEARLAFRI
jgi:ribosome maturation factor RimP